MKSKIKFIILLFLNFISQSLFAQTQENPFYSNGKIYVVVLVMSIIFSGIIIYLISIDRRLKKTERDLNRKD